MIKKILMSKSGMTLMEVVIGMLVVSVLMISIFSISAPLLKIYRRANDLAETNTLLDNLANQIVSDFSIAKIVSFTTDGKATITKVNDSSITYAVNGDGILYRVYSVEPIEMPVLAEGFYKNRKVLIEYYDGENYVGDDETDLDPADQNPIGASSFIIRVILLEKDDTEIARRDYAVKPIFLNQYTA